MNGQRSNVVIVCATVIVVAVIIGAVYLSTGGRTISANFMALAGLVLVQVVLQMMTIARTEQISNQVNGRFTTQQEITRKALEVIPSEVAAKITTDALNPPPDGSPEVESSTAGQPPAGPAGQRGQLK
jgi:hypothetical protein